MNRLEATRQTDDWFEQRQVRGQRTCCRCCSLISGQFVPMDVVDMVTLGSHAEFGDFVGTYVAYRCPQCGHHALSQAAEEEGHSVS